MARQLARDNRVYHVLVLCYAEPMIGTPPPVNATRCKCGGSGQITSYLNGNDDVTSAKVRCTKCGAETHAASEEAAVNRWHEKNAGAKG